MAEVILAQRMLGSGRDPALLPLYEHLGEVARRLFGLIHPYESVMRKLAVLAPAHDEAHLSRLVDVLTRRGRRGASVSVLARECALPATDVSAALARLEEAGTVRARTPGTTTPAFVLAAASTPRRGGRPAPRSPGRGAER